MTPQDYGEALKRIEQLERENAELRTIVDCLPTTADCVPIVSGMTIYGCYGGEIIPTTVSHVGLKCVYNQCFSAEEKAREYAKSIKCMTGATDA